jgi:hypothetical protein
MRARLLLALRAEVPARLEKIYVSRPHTRCRIAGESLHCAAAFFVTQIPMMSEAQAKTIAAPNPGRENFPGRKGRDARRAHAGAGFRMRLKPAVFDCAALDRFY